MTFFASMKNVRVEEPLRKPSAKSESVRRRAGSQRGGSRIYAGDDGVLGEVGDSVDARWDVQNRTSPEPPNAYGVHRVAKVLR